MDFASFRKSLKNLQPTQDEIPKLSRAVAVYPESAEEIFRVMAEEAISNSSKRLYIFYLFNDIVQLAARKRLMQFLEQGSGVFLHAFTPLVHRLPLTERKSYLRTIDIWKERSVYSENFCRRLGSEWASDGQREVSPKRAKTEPMEEPTSAVLEAVTKAEARVQSSKQRYSELLHRLTVGQNTPSCNAHAGIILSALEAVEADIALEAQQVAQAIKRLGEGHESFLL